MAPIPDILSCPTPFLASFQPADRDLADTARRSAQSARTQGQYDKHNVGYVRRQWDGENAAVGAFRQTLINHRSRGEDRRRAQVSETDRRNQPAGTDERLGDLQAFAKMSPIGGPNSAVVAPRHAAEVWRMRVCNIGLEEICLVS